ncbi:hypothetical protein FKW77_007931 [Venturia effusa]|uniref:Uncharacterized protein n=1 Tax=Venturia effusa TaxID=50376 RepID=A0A517L3R8_9PEZI|nr:hypothetical protein FKW77_007931 [Venturia effusa]
MASPAAETTDLRSGMDSEAKDGTTTNFSSIYHGSEDGEKVSEPSHAIKEEQRNGKAMPSPWCTIFGQGALVAVLMCGIAISMLVLTLVFQIKLLKAGKFSSDKYIFLQNVLTPAILFIASLASFSSIVLCRSLLKLYSFPLAHEFLMNTKLGDRGDLPSTRDFALVLRVLTGSPYAYVQAWRRSFSKSTRGRQIVRRVAVAYSFAILLSGVTILFSFLVCAYMHELKMPSTFAVGDGATNYGRALLHDCLQASSSGICQTRTDLHAGNDSDPVLTMKGLSDQNKIVRLDFKGLPEFHDESVVILADSRASKESSFTAKTYGISTWFKSIGSDCEVSTQSFNCSDHQFDGNFNNPVTIPKAAHVALEGNEARWVVAAKVQGAGGMFSNFANDPNFGVDTTSSFLTTVMHCETSVWEVEYLKLGDEYIPQTIKPTDTATTKMIVGPAFPGMIEGYNGFDVEDLATEFNARALQSHTTAQLAHNWAESFAKLAIASSAGIMDHIPVTQEFAHLIAIPRPFLFALGIWVFLYGLLGVALMLAAVRCVIARPEVREVQARMSISALVSAALEPWKSAQGVGKVEDMLGDDGRVGIYQTATGGYRWECRNDN